MSKDNFFLPTLLVCGSIYGSQGRVGMALTFYVMALIDAFIFIRRAFRLDEKLLPVEGIIDRLLNFFHFLPPASARTFAPRGAPFTMSLRTM